MKQKKSSVVPRQAWPGPPVSVGLEMTCLVDKGRETNRSSVGFPKLMKEDGSSHSFPSGALFEANE